MAPASSGARVATVTGLLRHERGHRHRPVPARGTAPAAVGPSGHGSSGIGTATSGVGTGTSVAERLTGVPGARREKSSKRGRPLEPFGVRHP